MKPLRLVEVTWLDAHSHGASAWSVYDAECKGTISAASRCRSVGYLMPETNDSVIVLAGSLAYDKSEISQFSGHMTIPRGMVQKIRTLN